MLTKKKFSLLEFYKKGLLLSEGGNVFDKVNSLVPREAANATIKLALRSVGLGNIEFDLVGNFSKPLLGDIDVSVSLKDVAQEYGIESIDSPNDFWKELDDHLKTFGVGYTVNRGLSQFHVLTEVVDDSGNVLDAVGPDGTVQVGTPGLVQIDVFIGNKEWMKTILSGAPDDSKFKAAYRNLLLAAIVSNAPSQDKNSKYVINFRDGLSVRKYNMLPNGKNEVVEKKVVLDNTDDLAAWLFGSSWSDINSFEKLWTELTGPNFEFPNELPKIVEDYKQILVKSHKEIPEQVTNFNA